MIKLSTAVIFTLAATLYLMNFFYGKNYHIEPLSFENLSNVSMKEYNRSAYYFTNPYRGIFEIKRWNYIIKSESYLAPRPRLVISAINQDGANLKIIKLTKNFQAECASFSNEKRMNGSVTSLLAFSRCSSEYMDSFEEESISFSIEDIDGKLLGNETLEFSVKQNGYYMISRGSI